MEDNRLKTIKLTQNKYAKVDDRDYSTLLSINWHFDGRYAANKNKKKIHMHRLIMGDLPLDIDHINGDKLDNRRSNLRFCTRSANIRNTDRVRKAKRVSYNKTLGYWAAKKLGGKHIGWFKTEHEALTAARGQVD